MGSHWKKYKQKSLQKTRRNDYERQIRRKKVQKKRRKQSHEPREGIAIPRSVRRYSYTPQIFDKNYLRKAAAPRRDEYIKRYLPPNLNFIVNKEGSPFNLGMIKKENYNSNGVVKVPKVFSIIEDPKSSYAVFKRVISALLLENNSRFFLDYTACEKVELGSQILLDIILKDFFRFSKMCHKIDRYGNTYFPVQVGGMNINNTDVQKIIFSVGSPVTLEVQEKKFDDIIPYKLVIHDNEKEKDLDKRMEQKELDTTEMADYVIECLARMNKELTPDKLDDLCTVIGEVLINAEEHSSTKYRFSIGYFKEENIEGEHFGIFRLVIMNFGQTIYEKFSAEDCPNQEIVGKMKNLSKSYTKRNLFMRREFEEENLWTLYALQEGVSSVSPDDYKRGNGSIRFIDSFFNIKGSQEEDNISYMTILSGKTRIVFNGKYSIQSKTNTKNETFKVMTFNESGDIEDKPDGDCVYQTDNYFPGTLISAKILLNDDDVIQIEN